MAAKTEVIEIRPIKIQKVNIRIVGDTPLIIHAWSEKAKRMMLEAQMGLAKGKKKEAKDPVDDFIRSLYWLTPMPEEMTEEGFQKAVENGARFGFPVTAMKELHSFERKYQTLTELYPLFLGIHKLDGTLNESNKEG